MAVGITLYSNRPEEMVPIAQAAEALGYEGVWLGDHVVVPEEMSQEHPYPKPVPWVQSGDDRIYDLWVTAGAIIGATSTLYVATGVCLAALRHPILTARACLSAHKLSKGRFRFGVGVGWLASEFEALGVPFSDRAKRLEEILDVLPKLFAGNGPVSHNGSYFAFPPLQMSREPARIPILFGGTKGPAIRRAALRGDGWYGTSVPLEEYCAIKQEIERIRKEHGLGDRPFQWIGRPQGPATIENLDRYRAAGFESLVLPWETVHPYGQSDMSLGAKLGSLERVARALKLVPR